MLEPSMSKKSTLQLVLFMMVDPLVNTRVATGRLDLYPTMIG